MKNTTTAPSRMSAITVIHPAPVVSLFTIASAWSSATTSAATQRTLSRNPR
ncbi:hypothetical protein [Novosphingobium guangzhouense]|uniref:hypothetical protein n=1 Tax=Novosphingobium guangzhouense TaxID=1850347 RepID=UPI001473782F|nr:hypothetical protein [Novosphingobium guangzhouense]